MSKRPHPSELKPGDVVAAPWPANIRVLKLTHIEETTLGEALGDGLPPDRDSAEPAWAAWGHPYVEGSGVEESREPNHHFVFADGSRFSERPILMQGAELGVEL
jgi:hypothetical protein